MTPLEEAAEAICECLRDRISYSAEIGAEEIEITAAIIKRELEKAVPARNDVVQHLQAAYQDGWNAHRKAMGLE